MKILDCTRCGLEDKVSAETVSFICSYCVIEILEPVKSTTKKKLGYPKGWRFMKEFVHANGTVYFRGVEQPTLKGTCEPTPIIEKPRVTKKEKAEQILTLLEEYNFLKSKLKTEKNKTTRKKIENRLNRISKLI